MRFQENGLKKFNTNCWILAGKIEKAEKILVQKKKGEEQEKGNKKTIEEKNKTLKVAVFK